MKLVFLAQAETDIILGHDWYESKRTGLGADFELCVEASIELIKDFPDMSPIWHRNTRKTNLAHFPYGVFYTVKNDCIYIVAIFHFKRNPVMLKRIVSKRNQKV